MKKILILSLILTGCGVKEKATESMTEKAIEAATGQQLDMSDIAQNSQDQKVEYDISFDGKPIFGSDKVFTGSVIMIKDQKGIGISGTYSSETGEQIMWIINNLQEGFSVPFTAKITNKDSELDGLPKAMVMCQSLNSNNMFNSPMPFSGTLKVSQLKADLIEIEFDAQGGPAGVAENQSAWKPFKGKMTFKNPVSIAQGVEKSTVFK